MGRDRRWRIVSALRGLLAVIGPVAGLFSLIWLIGIYAVAFGIMLVIAGFRVRSEQGGGTDRPSRVVGRVSNPPGFNPALIRTASRFHLGGSRPPVRWPGLPAGAWLGEVVTHELDADGETLREASRDAYGRDAGEVAGTAQRSLAYMARGSSTFSPILNATEGAVGESSTS